jgi:hypothetical protein
MVAETVHHNHPDYDHPHVVDLVNEAVSSLAPFSALILTVILVVFFLVRYYLFESFLMSKCYGDKYSNLNEVNRRGFVNHHIAGLARSSCSSSVPIHSSTWPLGRRDCTARSQDRRL